MSTSAYAAACGQKHFCAPRVRTAVRNWRRNLVVCFQADGEQAEGSNRVKIAMKIPYRVSFGQSLCVVGSSELLGNWNPTKSVPMTWSKDDWWTAEIDVASRDNVGLEYKYIVRNADGGVLYWKPGGNYKLDVPVCLGTDKYAGKIIVADAWDESFKKVEVEEVVINKGTAEIENEERTSAPPEPSQSDATTSSMETSTTTSNNSANLQPGAYQEDLEFTSEQELAALTSAERKAFKELENSLASHELIQSDASDPADPKVLMADRMVAHSKNKAIALSKALAASTPAKELQTDSNSKPSINGTTSGNVSVI